MYLSETQPFFSSNRTTAFANPEPTRHTSFRSPSTLPKCGCLRKPAGRGNRLHVETQPRPSRPKVTIFCFFRCPVPDEELHARGLCALQRGEELRLTAAVAARRLEHLRAHGRQRKPEESQTGGQQQSPRQQQQHSAHRHHVRGEQLPEGRGLLEEPLQVRGAQVAFQVRGRTRHGARLYGRKTRRKSDTQRRPNGSEAPRNA